MKQHLQRILICIFIFCGIPFATGQETVPFSARYTNQVKGNIIMTGNDIVGPLLQSNTSVYSDPNQAYNGTLNNGNYKTAFIDIDGDPSTFSSSAADLNAPNNECSTLVYAGLYWSANYYMQRVETPNSFVEAEISSSVDTNVNFIINNGDLAESYEARYSDFDSDISDIRLNPVTSYLVLAQPVDGCAITNGSQLSGNIAVIEDGGTCSIREKVVNAQNAGAIGVVIVNDNNNLMPKLEGDGPTINIPSVSIGNNDITNRTTTEGNLIALLQSNTDVILATLSTEGDDILTGLPLTDPRKQGPADFRNVKLKLPNGTNYIDITAQSVVFDGYRNTPTNAINEANDETPYVCYADITSLLDPDNHFGTYTLADMNATQGFTSGADGACGGWFIVAVYENLSETAKQISTNDGFVQIFRGGDPIDFTYAGFTTPPASQSVRAMYGIASLEGDTSLGGDNIQIENTSGTFVSLSSRPVNPANNFFNGSISFNGNHITDRLPASQNTQGFDVDIFELPNVGNSLIGNNQTSTRFRVSTDQDRFSVFFNTLAIELNEPELRMIKRVYDTDGVTEITGQNVELGDELFYDLEIENIGTENFVDGSVVITDVLPANTNLVNIQDATLPPGVTYAETSPGVIQFYIPSALLEAGADPSIFIRFRVQLVADCESLRDACSNIIENIATASYTGLESGITKTTQSGSTLDACGNVNGGASNVLVNVPPCSIDVALCSSDLTLVAGAGYDQYQWSGPDGFATTTSSNSINIPNTLIGVYTVSKVDTNPSDGTCMTLSEEFNVTSIADAQNPILNYVNGTTVITEDCSGLQIPQILLCGDQSLLLESGFDPNNVNSISWQRLSPSGACITDPNDPCSLLSGDCTDANWVEEPSGNELNFTVSELGDYRILVEFDNGCFKPFFFSVFKNDYQPQLEMTPIACGNDGIVEVTNAPNNFAFSLTSGGPYTNTTGVFAISTPGDVTVYAIDTTFPGCEYTATITVPLIDPTFNITTIDPSCTGDEGIITVDVTDGIPPFTYTLTTATGTVIGPIVDGNSFIFTNLQAGVYTVEVSDSIGCLYTDNVTINEPSPISEVSSIITPITCGGIGNDLGSLELTISGGIANYTFTLVEESNIGIFPLVPATTTSANPVVQPNQTVIFNDLDFGSYYIFAEDQNGCTESFGPYTIASPPNDLDILATSSGTCSTGVTLDVSVVGGSGAAGGFEIRLVDIPSFDTFAPLNGAGSPPVRDHQYIGLPYNIDYTIEVRDNTTGCLYQETIQAVSPPSEPEIINTVVTDATCNQNNGSISFDITGYGVGVTEITWEVFNSANNVSLGVAFTGSDNVNPGLGLDIPVTITGLPTGIFYLIAQEIDGTQCPGRFDFSIESSDFLSSTVTSVTPANGCGTNAFATVQTTGGSPFSIPPTADGYQYAVVADGAGDPGVYPLNSNVIDLGNVSGEFDIWVSDAAGCVFGPLDVFVTVTSTPIITSLPAFVDDPCTFDNNYTFTVTATGEGQLSYQLNNGTQVPGNISNTEHQFTVTQAGTYTVTVYDDSGCSSNSETITVFEELVVNAEFTIEPTCTNSNGVITATAIGGSDFSVNPGNFTFQLTGTDNSGNPITPVVQSSNIFTGISAGTYEITVTDSSISPSGGCFATDNVSRDIPTITNLIVTQLDPVTCSNPEVIQASITRDTGNVSGFEFDIVETGGSDAQIVAEDPSGTTSALLSILEPGTYTIRVTDLDTGCIIESSYTVDPYDLIEVAVSQVTPVACAGEATGEISIDITGYTGDYNYTVFNIDASTTVTSGSAGTNVNPLLITGLPSGFFEVIIDQSDAPFCTSNFNYVEVTQLTAISADVFVTKDLSCIPGQENAEITINNTTGGSGVYEWSFDAAGPFTTVSETTVIDITDPGNYTIYLRDPNAPACPSTFDVTIDPISTPFVSASTTDISCFGDTDGSIIIDIDPNTGTPPYAISFNGATFTDQTVYTGLDAGTYTYTVRDANQCSVTEVVTISEPSPLTFDVSTTSITVEADGLIEVINVIGGTAPYEYELRTSNSVIVPFQLDNNIFTITTAGNYIVAVRDANGCETIQQVTMLPPDNQNPLIDYADEILFCAITGQSYPVITIQDENGEILELPYVDVLSIVWEKLDEISCSIELDENCPTTDSSCSSDWFEIATGPSCTITEVGEYRVVIQFANRTVNNIQTYYFRADGNTLGIDDFETPKMVLTPNPAIDRVEVSSKFEKLVMYDMTGKKVMETVARSFDVSELESGIYFVSITDQKGNETLLKLMKR